MKWAWRPGRRETEHLKHSGHRLAHVAPHVWVGELQHGGDRREARHLQDGVGLLDRERGPLGCPAGGTPLEA